MPCTISSSVSRLNRGWSCGPQMPRGAVLHRTEFAAAARACRGAELLIGRVDLRRVPPVCVEIEVGGRSSVVTCWTGVVGDRARDEHRVLPEVITGGQRHLPGI